MKPATKFPETIIEIYDEEQIYNVLAITEFKPKNVVYIGTRKLKSKKLKTSIISCYRSLGIEVRCYFYSTDMLSISSIKNELLTIEKEFPNYVIDLTGGSEVALVAVGMLAKEYGIPLMRYDKYESRYRNIFNCPIAEKLISAPHFTVEAFMKLAGSEIKQHGHIAIDSLDHMTAQDIFRAWDIFKRQYQSWHRMVLYLQQVSKRTSDSKELSVSAPTLIYSGERIVNCETMLMNELAAARLILDYSQKNGRVSFRYKNELMRSCLIDTGICLELYVYATAMQSREFDDVKISVVVDWDGDLEARINTLNEIDVMLVHGQVPLFVSCKSGSPNVVALNEIKMLASQFGGENGRAVLVTMADVRTNDPFLYQRAADMGVALIDYTDLIDDKLEKKLLTAARL